MNLILAIIALGATLVAGRSPFETITGNNQDEIVKLLHKVDSKWLQSNVVLRVSVPVKNTSISAGEMLEMSCEMGGTPIPAINWLVNGVTIQGDGILNIEEKLSNRGKATAETGITSTALHVPRAQPFHSGVYTCVGFNGYTQVESSAYVVVDGKEMDIDFEIHAPRMTQWTPTRIENVGNTVTIACRSDYGSDWTWTFEEHPISHGGRYEIKTNGDLVIHNIETMDTGAYFCTVQNSAGNGTAENFLYVTSA